MATSPAQSPGTNKPSPFSGRGQTARLNPCPAPGFPSRLAAFSSAAMALSALSTQGPCLWLPPGPGRALSPAPLLQATARLASRDAPRVGRVSRSLVDGSSAVWRARPWSSFALPAQRRARTDASHARRGVFCARRQASRSPARRSSRLPPHPRPGTPHGSLPRRRTRLRQPVEEALRRAGATHGDSSPSCSRTLGSAITYDDREARITDRV